MTSCAGWDHFLKPSLTFLISVESNRPRAGCSGRRDSQGGPGATFQTNQSEFPGHLPPSVVCQPGHVLLSSIRSFSLPQRMHYWRNRGKIILLEECQDLILFFGGQSVTPQGQGP